MGMEEIAGEARRIADHAAGWPAELFTAAASPVGTRQVKEDLARLAKRIEAEAADDGHPDLALRGDGFVVLPVGRFDELRQAEEDLATLRGEVTEAAAGRDREIAKLRTACVEYHSRFQAMQEEIGRLREPQDGSPLHPPLAMAHMKDLQADLVKLGKAIRDESFERSRQHAHLLENHLQHDLRIKSLGARLAEVERKAGVTP